MARGNHLGTSFPTSGGRGTPSPAQRRPYCKPTNPPDGRASIAANRPSVLAHVDRRPSVPLSRCNLPNPLPPNRSISLRGELLCLSARPRSVLRMPQPERPARWPRWWSFRRCTETCPERYRCVNKFRETENAGLGRTASAAWVRCRVL